MENNRAILEGLDGQQRAAVSQTEGPVLIVAGAGAGKTRVLTGRIAYILENGGEPDRILALTFTKKAAAEMKERIAAMVGDRKARRLYMGTFHSVFIRFLREYAECLGYPSGFTIYDTSDSISAIKSCLKELKLDDKVYKPKDVLGRISMAKNNLVTPEVYKKDAQAIINDTHAKKPEICNIYMLYAAKCKQAGVMDFDDILLNMNILFRDNPAALKDIASRFDYILVDEYQDTNSAQYLILKKLSQFHRNICVVGDDSQSIYAFRGARIENILNFRKDYPDCKLFRLEQNYRSTQVIVDAANSVIEKNSSRIPKTCFSKGPEGDKIHLIKAYTEQEEAILIASSIIARMEKDHCQYQDFAILYRTNSQSRALEEALRKRNLPYQIYSGNSFFERAEVKDMMAYLKLAVNPNDDESFRRVLNTPARGIGATSEEALVNAARSRGLSLFNACEPTILESAGIKSAAAGRIMAFKNMMAMANAALTKEDAFTVADMLSKQSGLYASFKNDNSIESQSRAANIEELLNSVQSFVEDRQNQYREELLAEGSAEDVDAIQDSELPLVTLGDFLEDVSLLSAVDVSDDEDVSNKITMMTVHSSKGLEFPYVYVAGMEENIFPSGGMFSDPVQIEEERRLFYVALTRAKVAVNLSFAATRMRNGKHEQNSPSRFVKEIDRRYVDNPISDDEDVNVQESGGFRGFGSRFNVGNSGGGRFRETAYNNRYGTSGAVVTEKRAAPVSPVTGRPLRSAAAPDRKPVSAAPRTPDADFSPVSVLELKVGQRIEHNRFGYGVIRQITGTGMDLKAKILFDSFGEKILLLKYAKIRVDKTIK
ncbi:MAG: UvrD-helicase domain-containing protein [Bacteroides sp.]|nr:UvrD-helicase domain-containing protein [Bacteroides sp.]